MSKPHGEPMNPWLLHLAKRDDADRWRVGFDCGEIVFYQDVVVRDPQNLPKEIARGFGKAAKAAEHHHSLPERERREREQLLKKAHEEPE